MRLDLPRLRGNSRLFAAFAVVAVAAGTLCEVSDPLLHAGATVTTARKARVRVAQECW